MYYSVIRKSLSVVRLWDLTSSNVFWSFFTKPLAATITSNRKTSPSPLDSAFTALNFGYSALSYLKRRRKKVRIHSTSRLKYLGGCHQRALNKAEWTHHSAFSCDVLTICGKSMTTGSPLSRCIRILNSL